MKRTLFVISYLCTFPLFFVGEKVSALGGQYDLLCAGLEVKLIEKDCSDKVKKVSKCQFDDLKNYVCKNWRGGDTGPLQRIHVSGNYSHFDNRIVISTEDMKKKIYRYELEHEVITYAWEQWKDLDFILMIQEESLWEEFIFGDNGTSIGYCQISKIYGKELYEAYIAAKDWKERINICHNHYLKFSHNVGIVFHGWKTRMRNLPSFTLK